MKQIPRYCPVCGENGSKYTKVDDDVFDEDSDVGAGFILKCDNCCITATVFIDKEKDGYEKNLDK